MLSEPAASSGDSHSLESRVRDLIAEAAGMPAGAPLLDMSLDSLTLLAIVTRIEAAFAIAFEGDETMALLTAADAGELARLVARKVAERHANVDEMTRNGSCPPGENAR